MKYTFVFIVPCLFLSACASRSAPSRVMIRPVSSSSMDAKPAARVRSAETLKAYPLGRYIDPNNSKIMHEAHTLYRVESTAHWNLRPSAAEGFPARYHRDSALADASTRGELLVELNRQKQTTAAVVQGNQAVSGRLNELLQKVQEGGHWAEQNARLEQELASTKVRLEQLEARIAEQSAASANGSRSGKVNKGELPDW